VSTTCTYDPELDQRVMGGDEESRDDFKCIPRPKGCPRFPHPSVGADAAKLPALRATILHLVCGYYEPTEEAREILLHGLDESRRCAMAAAVSPMIREVLWNRCCRHLPAGSKLVAFSDAVRSAAPECMAALSSSALGDELQELPAQVNASCMSSLQMDHKASHKASRGNGAAFDRLAPWRRHDHDAFMRAYIDMSRSLDRTFHEMQAPRDTATAWSSQTEAGAAVAALIRCNRSSGRDRDHLERLVREDATCDEQTMIVDGMRVTIRGACK
jgi:hypothetical protein